MFGNFDCCRYCKPPKRKLECHGSCEDYAKAKAIHDADMDRVRKAKKEEEDANSVTFTMKRS
jgi:hypothetical protein